MLVFRLVELDKARQVLVVARSEEEFPYETHWWYHWSLRRSLRFARSLLQSCHDLTQVVQLVASEHILTARASLVLECSANCLSHVINVDGSILEVELIVLGEN